MPQPYEYEEVAPVKGSLFGSFSVPNFRLYISGHFTSMTGSWMQGVALNSASLHAARVVGPAIAGIIIAKWGEGTCFAANALSFLAFILALSLIDDSKLHKHTTHNLPIYHAIKEGLKTAWKNRELRRRKIRLFAGTYDRRSLSNNRRVMVYLEWVSTKEVLSQARLLPDRRSQGPLPCGP